MTGDVRGPDARGPRFCEITVDILIKRKETLGPSDRLTDLINSKIVGMRPAECSRIRRMYSSDVMERIL